MRKGNTFNNNVIVRFLMNEATKEEVLLLEQWLDSSAENREYFHKIRDTWNSIELEKELDATRISADFDRILHQIDSRKTKGRFPLNAGRNLRQTWRLKSAAIFILGFAVSWYIFDKPMASTPEETAYNIVETPRGSRATVKLPDGSEVLLNADSKLTYPPEFKTDERKVLLEGEAFFKVEKDAKRQFFVKTPDITVKVFGTSFNVKSYPDEHTTETTLVEGSISIFKNSVDGEMSGTELKMEPNQRMVLYREPVRETPPEVTHKRVEDLPERKAKLVLSKHIDTERFTSWTAGRLKIESETMVKMAATLERRYDVKIHFENEEIKQFRFSGTFKNETIEQVMAAIKLAAPISYRMEDRNIWINAVDN
ncbi:MAG: FecR domain-containing protein [Cytophagales bacterium]|nr:FecR domain-containing protein [Cytophagales bacterium]